MINNNFKQLVIVCRNFQVDWTQFINPIYVGVETGILNLINHQKTINFICGDNDTISKQDLANIKNKYPHLTNVVFQKEKDFLDSELAIITAIEKPIIFQQLVIVSDGNRWDMLLASINLMKKYAQYEPILVGQNNYAFILKAPITYFFNQNQKKYDYISIFNLELKDAIYNFSGCKYYSDQDVVVENQGTRAISNEFLKLTKQPSITIKKGQCLILLHKKEE